MLSTKQQQSVVDICTSQDIFINASHARFIEYIVCKEITGKLVLLHPVGVSPYPTKSCTRLVGKKALTRIRNRLIPGTTSIIDAYI